MHQKQNTGSSAWLWFALIAGLGVTARFWVSTLGHNYDFESYRIVTGLMVQGQDVYSHTTRYNYGPVWFNVLHLLDLLAGHNPAVFRWLLVGLLSVADLGIFWVLWHKFGKLAGVMFFLNPVSIIISGFHNQFDNLAILIGICGVLLMGDDFAKPVDRRKFSGLALIGLSLMTKHILFAFPCWLAVKQKGIVQKLLVVFVPVLIFFAGFLPYWAAGSHGIIQNVFLYRSKPDDSFAHFFVPLCLQVLTTSQILWLAGLVLFAFIYRRQNALKSLLFYTAVLTAFAPAIALQYLAIPLAFIVVWVNCLTVAYTICAGLTAAVYPDGLGLSPIFPFTSTGVPICVLALAVIWTTWRSQIISAARFFYRWGHSEIVHQLGTKK